MINLINTTKYKKCLLLKIRNLCILEKYIFGYKEVTNQNLISIIIKIFLDVIIT
jgi:hypothetical protein